MKEYTTVDVERGLAIWKGRRKSISSMLNELSIDGWEVISCLPSINVDGTILLGREKSEERDEEERMEKERARAAFNTHEAEKYSNERQTGEHKEMSWLESLEKDKKEEEENE